jgi:glycosyltransferase involved in cell wall biosynthesis
VKVLILPELYPPVIGGLEMHAQRLAHALARRGHEVVVCTLAGGDGPRERTDGGITVIEIDGWRRHLARAYEDPARAFHIPMPDPGVVRALRSVLDSQRPDVVHAHGWILYSALVAVPGSGARLLATLHDFGLVCARRNLLHHGERLCSGPRLGKCLRCAPEQYGVLKATPVVLGHRASTRLLNGRCDRYLAVSHAVRDAVVRSGADGGAPVDVIPNFVDLAAIDATSHDPRPAWVPPEGPFVLFVGALTAFKGIGDLLEVWRRDPPDAHLVLAGTPRPDTPRSLPPRVSLVEDVAHREVLAATRHAAVSVTPSVGPDACPSTVIEAMACATAVVGTTVGGIPDLIEHEVDGLLVAPANPGALRAAVVALLDDPDLRHRMARSARERSSLFGTDTVTARVEDAYSEAMAAEAVPT